MQGGQQLESRVSQAAEPVAPRRVLAVVDGSPASWAAVAQAIAIAERERALLTLAAVVPEPSPWVSAGLLGVPFTRESLRREGQRAMERELAAARDEVPASVSVTTRLLQGHPARAIARLAAEGAFDVVLGGPRGTLDWVTRRTPMLALRYGLPVLVILAGFVILLATGGSNRWEGWAMCVGAGLSIALLNVLFRIGARGDRERDEEEAARHYLAEHGHWPDEHPRA
jgi:nucleotide-binding universal stress UspA family protein